MRIDGRQHDVTEVLRQIKSYFSDRTGSVVDLEIFVRSAEDASKVKAYMNMSGCSSVSMERLGDGSIMIRATGGACRCG
jgi:hypothetical protein